MILWLDAHLPPSLSSWVTETFGVSCQALSDVGLRDASDHLIFQEAGSKGAVVVTKDADFVLLQAQKGPPPQILWLTCGNTSKARLKEVFATSVMKALGLLQQGEPLVEIR
jgi:predicted nuclease of predicted toxin-antitoxin system